MYDKLFLYNIKKILHKYNMNIFVHDDVFSIFILKSPPQIRLQKLDRKKFHKLQTK